MVPSADWLKAREGRKRTPLQPITPPSHRPCASSRRSDKESGAVPPSPYGLRMWWVISLSFATSPRHILSKRSSIYGPEYLV